MRRNGNGKHADPLTLANLIIPGVASDDDAYAKLKMRLDCYEDTILARKFDKGAPGPVFALDPLDVATALAGVNITTPYLPKNCLFWQRPSTGSGGGERLAIYCEPKVWPVHVAVAGENDDPKRKRGKRQRLLVPMPGLVWYGCGLEYGLYAVKGGAWPGPETELWAAPVPNMSGAICRGNVEFPQASAATIWQALGLFFESDFNNHLSDGKSLAYKASILDQWAALHEAGAETYPEDDLVKSRQTLKDLMEASNR